MEIPSFECVIINFLLWIHKSTHGTLHWLWQYLSLLRNQWKTICEHTLSLTTTINRSANSYTSIFFFTVVVPIELNEKYFPLYGKRNRENSFPPTHTSTYSDNKENWSTHTYGWNEICHIVNYCHAWWYGTVKFEYLCCIRMLERWV